ncbi:hypothetical protein [Bradyrhizobium sp. Tv2a-2]|uniref:hypothetical protein n=1 Tax=Bradyrhizobium sp. Tv2a-2 TaxID=113395 RepID=UPI00040DAD5D|nr:hypothetical protein [Bradyrhizobium sp. Tv2a-2]
MVADSDSKIAWHRVQLKRNREAVKSLETTRFTTGDIGPKAAAAPQGNIAELKRKIAESERCISEYEKRTRRPLTTDFKTLASVSWSNWDASPAQTRKDAPR